MQPIQQRASQRIAALYDSKCPLCRFGASNYEIGAEHGGLDIIDMGEASALQTEALTKGFDLDKGVVVKSGDQLYYAGDAIHFMAMRVDRSKWVNRQVYR